MTLEQILQMMRTPQPSGLGQVSNQETEAMRAAIAGAGSTGIPTPPVDMNARQRELIEAFRKGGQTGMGQVSNAEAATMNQLSEGVPPLMGGLSAGIPSAVANPARTMSPLEQVRKAMETRQLSLPSSEGMPNYANNEMPLYTGGLLENMQGQAVDPQQLLNTAYDMSAPREMRINAIERLRALGVI